MILEEKIQPHIPTIAQLGTGGKVAEAWEFYNDLQKQFAELDALRTCDPTHPSYRPDKRMEVCQVCGALLANDSTGGRIEAHMIGKQHTGYMRIRKAIEDQKVRKIILILERSESIKIIFQFIQMNKLKKLT